VSAVLLATTSAALFGGLAVAIRLALRHGGDAELGALLSALVGLAVCALAGASSVGGVGAADLGSFALAGMIAPGLTQIMFFRAVRDVGPARAAVLVGTAPLASVVIAIVWLGEPVRLALVVAALLIVVGGIALAGERIRPEYFKAAGAVLAVLAAVLFATRDNVIRRLALDTDAPPLPAASATLVGGLVVILAYLLATRRGRLREAPFEFKQQTVTKVLWAWLPAGLLFGLSYAAMFEAYYRGRVTVVSPLIATESLFGVLFSALVLGRSELIGRRLVLGASLVVAGGALIGASR
jgi:drug/metabolite transporter (DMT)-like permease